MFKHLPMKGMCGGGSELRDVQTPEEFVMLRHILKCRLWETEYITAGTVLLAERCQLKRGISRKKFQNVMFCYHRPVVAKPFKPPTQNEGSHGQTMPDRR